LNEKNPALFSLQFLYHAVDQLCERKIRNTGNDVVTLVDGDQDSLCSAFSHRTCHSRCDFPEHGIRNNNSDGTDDHIRAPAAYLNSIFSGGSMIGARLMHGGSRNAVCSDSSDDAVRKGLFYGRDQLLSYSAALTVYDQNVHHGISSGIQKYIFPWFYLQQPFLQSILKINPDGRIFRTVRAENGDNRMDQNTGLNTNPDIPEKDTDSLRKSPDAGKNKNKGHKIRKGTVIAAAVILFLAVVFGFCAWGILTSKTQPSPEETPAQNVPVKRVVYYNNTGIYEYLPETAESDRITKITKDTYDRSESRFADKNLADGVRFSSDGHYAFCLKNYSYTLFYKSADLCCIDITKPEDKREDILISGNVLQYDILSDDRILFLDGDGKLYLQDIPGKNTDPQRDRLDADVTGYYADQKKNKIFWFNSFGMGYSLDIEKGTGKTKTAEGVASVLFTSDDLNTIYYTNYGSDLMIVKDLARASIVDTDVTDLAVIKKTGHAYFLKLPQQEAESAGTETEMASEPDAEQRTEKNSSDLVTAESKGGDTQNSTKSVTGTLSYYDGEKKTVLSENILAISSTNNNDMEHDRLIAESGAADGYEIYLADEEKLLDTGLNLNDDGLVDISPDYSEDILYYIRQEGEEKGSLSKGTLYAIAYTKDGFDKTPDKLQDKAVAIPAAKFGNVYTTSYNEGDYTTALYLNGNLLGQHVSSFYWNNEKKSDDTDLYCDVFTSSDYQSGRFVRVKNGVSRDIAYNVFRCNGFKDGSYTFLTDYDVEEGTGTLVYWNNGDPVVVSREVTGTTAGDVD